MFGRRYRVTIKLMDKGATVWDIPTAHSVRKRRGMLIVKADDGVFRFPVINVKSVDRRPR